MDLKLFIILVTFTISSLASKLNVPRVLLPLFYEFSTNFTLEVTDAGCYTWTTLRPNVVRLQCLDADTEFGCCSKVVVSAASKEFRRDTETVLAEGVHSGLILRCEVILNVIHSLSIVTTTREIYLDESPEAFEVRAYDDQGNEFSTLEGVELEWSFMTVGNRSASGESTVVRYITFAESPYETVPAVEELERQGLRGSVVLLEGRQTGTAAISVRLPQSEYEAVATAGVQLSVLTNLIVTPKEATILEGDNINYRLQQFQHGRVKEIFFPSTQYHLTSKDPSVSVDPTTGVASGLAIGQARVVLIDGNVGTTDVKPPTALLSVAAPKEIQLAVLPTRKWSVVVGQTYDIVAELYDSYRKRFHIGEKASLLIQLNEGYFRVKSRPQNGSYVSGTPLKAGKIEVTGELLGVKDTMNRLKHIDYLSATEELHIFEPVRVNPSSVFLPWDPVAKARYEVPLSATGGDGIFTWSSIRSAVAVVTQRGVVKTLEEGMTTVVAAMTQNLAIRGSSVVRVMPPTHLEILDTPLEAEVGSPIFIHIGLYGLVDDKQVPFTLCDALPFDTILSEKKFIRVAANNTDRPEPACTTIPVIGYVAGTSHVTVSYAGLSATVVVAAYLPLSILNPSSATTLLSVGSSRLIVFTGGPRSWTQKPSEHFHSLSHPDLEEESLDVVEESGRIPSSLREFYPYRVTCKQLSETALTLHVVNKVVGSNSRPSEASSTVTVICGKPKYLSLAPVAKNVTRCPLHQEEVVALTYEDLDIAVTVKDAQGRTFDNVTSLDFEWSLTRASLAKIPEPRGIKSAPIEEEGFLFPGTWYQTVSPFGRIGVVEIRSRVTGYNGEVLFAQGVVAESPAFPESVDGIVQTPDIRASLILTLVNATVASPNRTELFMSAGIVADVQVYRGSGHFDVNTNGSGIIDVERVGRTIRLRPLQIGTIQMDIVDVCLDTDPVQVFVQVYRIGEITVDVVEFIERGRSVVAHAVLFDESGVRLSSKLDTTILKLKPLPASNLITVQPEREPEAGEAAFTVHGVSLGQSALAITAGGVTSKEAPIYVFPQLRLNPRNLTLLVGSLLQLSTVDGPPGAHIEFIIDDGLTAKVSDDGVLEGVRIGNCVLTAKAIVVHKLSGRKFVASQDQVDVRVVPLKGVSIHAPITRIIAGRRMPLWAVGLPGSAGLLRIGVHFTWSISQENSASLRSVYQDLGFRAPNSELMAVHFYALKPGRVTVSLNVQVSAQVAGSAHDAEYSDSVTIEVLPGTSLSSPRTMTLDQLLVSPDAKTELRASRDIRRYQISVLLGDPDVVRVSPDGILTSGSTTGVAVIALGPVEKPYSHVVVYVKPVEYIMMNVVPHWRVRPQGTLSVLPTGLDVELKVSFHDDLGNEFDAVRSNIIVDPGQKGVVNVIRGAENGSLVMQILESGATTLRVLDARTPHQPTDLLHVQSGDVLYPVNARVSVGDVVCLRMPLISSEDSTSPWIVDDPTKLRLWPDLGVVVACDQPGVATVAHRLSTRLRSRIEVLPINRIDLLPHEVILSTAPGSVVEYPLVVQAAGETSKRNNLIAFNNTCGAHVPRDFAPSCYPFHCRLKFNNPVASADVDSLFQVTAAFNLETGVYSCRVQSVGKLSVSSATLSEAIVLQAISIDGSVQSRATLVPFLPAVFLHQTELKVSHNKPHDLFTISGVQDVFNQLKVITDKHLVSVVVTGQTDNSRTYSVSVDPVWWTLNDPPALSVLLWSKSTSQKLQMPIRCFGPRMMGQDDFWSTTKLVILVVVAITVIFGIYYWPQFFSSREVVTTTEPPQYLPYSPDFHYSPSRNSSRTSQEFSPVDRQFDEPFVYGSPWRYDTKARRRVNQ